MSITELAGHMEGNLVNMLTGHCPVRYHLRLVGLVELAFIKFASIEQRC